MPSNKYVLRFASEKTMRAPSTSAPRLQQLAAVAQGRQLLQLTPPRYPKLLETFAVKTPTATSQLLMHHIGRERSITSLEARGILASRPERRNHGLRMMTSSCWRCLLAFAPTSIRRGCPPCQPDGIRLHEILIRKLTQKKIFFQAEVGIRCRDG